VNGWFHVSADLPLRSYPPTNIIRGWVGPRARLDVSVKRQIIVPTRIGDLSHPKRPNRLLGPSTSSFLAYRSGPSAMRIVFSPGRAVSLFIQWADTHLRNVSWQSGRLDIIYSDNWLKFKNLLHFTCSLNIICAVCRYADIENKNIKLVNLFWITDCI
jgi:hypothetical protein